MKLHRRIRLAVVPAALGIAALAVPAGGLAKANDNTVPVWARYRVTIQGSAHYYATAKEGTRNGIVYASFRFKGAVNDVTFRSSSGFDPSPFGTAKISQVRLDTGEVDTRPNANPDRGSCKGRTGQVTGHGLVVHGMGSPPRSDGATLIVDPFQGASLDATCDGLLSTVHNFPFVNIELPEDDYTLAPFDSVITLPPAALRMGKVIEHYHGGTGARCPYDPATTDCELNLNMTITLVRTAHSPKSADLGAPAPSTGGPSTGQPGSPSEAPPVTKNPTVAPDGSGASVNVGCTGPCGYLVQAFTLATVGRAPDAAPATSIAAAHGFLRSSGSKRVTLWFPAAARQAVRQAGGVRLVVYAVSGTGQLSKPRTITLRLGHH